MAHSSSASKPKSSEYAPINIQAESPLTPHHRPKSNSLLKIRNSLSNHRKPAKSPKSVSNKLLQLKLKPNASIISAYSDSDSYESKTPHLSSPKKIKTQFTYNFGDNEQIIKQELIESVLEQLKIGLTFLLHDESPLWNHEMDENDEEIDLSDDHKQQSSFIFAKGALSMNSNASFASYKPIGFQQRCTEYNKSGALYGEFKRTQKCVNQLFDIKYMKEHSALHTLWSQWQYYAKLKEDGHRINIRHLKLRDEIQENHQALEDDCIDFVESKTITKKTANAVVSAINKLRGKTDESDEYLAKSATISSLRIRSTQRSLSPRKSMHKSPITSPIANAAAILDVDCSEHQLKTVKTRQEMKKWIERFKSTEIVRRSCVCCGVKWIKVCFSQICCECKGLLDIIEKDDKNLRIPMDLWSWQNVVACIEDAVYVDDDGLQYELKHFASVFWQYQIEGKELVVMDVLQIELLVECWFLNNIQEQYFDEIKMKTQQDHDEAWHLSQESEYLMRYINKLRIHSHVVSRYQLSMDIMHLIVTESHAAEHNTII